jgi:hypothetical protein
MILLEIEVGSNTFKSVVITVSADSFPLLPGLLKLMALDQRNNQVDLHELLLISCQVLICLELLRNSFSKLVPIEVPDELFEVVLVDLVSLLESVHVKFN